MQLLGTYLYFKHNIQVISFSLIWAINKYTIINNEYGEQFLLKHFICFFCDSYSQMFFWFTECLGKEL